MLRSGSGEAIYGPLLSGLGLIAPGQFRSRTSYIRRAGSLTTAHAFRRGRHPFGSRSASRSARRTGRWAGRLSGLARSRTARSPPCSGSPRLRDHPRDPDFPGRSGRSPSTPATVRDEARARSRGERPPPRPRSSCSAARYGRPRRRDENRGCGALATSTRARAGVRVSEMSIGSEYVTLSFRDDESARQQRNRIAFACPGMALIAPTVAPGIARR